MIQKAPDDTKWVTAFRLKINHIHWTGGQIHVAYVIARFEVDVKATVSEKY